MTHRGCAMVYHGTPYYTMVYHGTTVFAVVPWFTMVSNGIPWYTIVYHGNTMVTPWCTMVYHGMVYYGTPWYTMVYHGIPCLHHGIAWHTMFAGDLHTRTSVAHLPLHQLDYLVVN